MVMDRLGHKWCSNFAGPWCWVLGSSMWGGTGNEETVLLIENKDTSCSSVFISFSIVPVFILQKKLFLSLLSACFCFFSYKKQASTDRWSTNILYVIRKYF